MLRYRPGGDVLLGSLQLEQMLQHRHPATPHEHDHARNVCAVQEHAIATHSAAHCEQSNDRATVDEVVDRLDANTRLTWHVPRSGPLAGKAVLQSFEIVHAQARWELDELSMLPPAVAAASFSAIAEATATYGTLETVAERIRCRIEHTLKFPAASLLRSGTRPVAHESGTFRAALGVARALEQLSSVLRTTQRSDGDAIATERLIRFCSLAEELGAVLADGDDPPLPAPGTSAALRAELRGGLPLGRSERNALRAALTDVDHAGKWDDVTQQLLQLITALDTSPEPGAFPPRD